MSRAVALALVAAAMPVGAQELRFDPGPTLSCLSRGGAETCIGRAAETCMAGPDGDTTVGMGYCFDAEWQFWDARLNAAYDRLIEAETAMDRRMAEIGATAPRTGPALRDMQRAWIGFRDALCDYELAQWGGGTGQGPATAACLMSETGRQALRLEARMAELEAR